MAIRRKRVTKLNGRVTKHNGRSTIVCPAAARAHALRHELDRAGALSKRKGQRIETNANTKAILAAMKRAKRSAHHGHMR